MAQTLTKTTNKVGQLNVAVVYTNQEDTLAALREAGELAASLNGQIMLLYPQVVPYPLPLDKPPVNLAFLRKNLYTLACGTAIETHVRVILCRDANDAVKNALKDAGPQVVLLTPPKRRLCWPISFTAPLRWLSSFSAGALRKLATAYRGTHD